MQYKTLYKQYLQHRANAASDPEQVAFTTYYDRLNYDTGIVRIPIVNLYFGLLSILIFAFTDYSVDSIFFQTWLLIFIACLLRFIWFIHPPTRKNLTLYQGSVHTIILSFVLLNLPLIKTFDEQILIFFFIAIDCCRVYGGTRYRIAAGWIVCTGVLSLLLVYMMQDSIPGMLFHLYFTFPNFASLLFSYYNENFIRLSYKQHLLRKQLRELAQRDGLTGIANRRYFDDNYLKLWQKSISNKESISVLIIDIDFYKKYNDCYGHMAGDECLVLVAQLLTKTVQLPEAIVARYGGEEFVVVLPYTNAQQATSVAEAISEAIKQEHIAHKDSLVAKQITVSIGIAVCIVSEKTEPTRLVNNADQALYQAKHNGRNQWQLHDLCNDDE